MDGIVSPDYVRARWAYSELLSLAHGHYYEGVGVPELKEKAHQEVPFEELGRAEQYLLVDQFDRVRGRYFNRYLVGITAFKLVDWGKDDLAAVYVISYFVRDVSSIDHQLQRLDRGRVGETASPGSCSVRRIRCSSLHAG